MIRLRERGEVGRARENRRKRDERSGRPRLFLYEGRRLDEWLPEVVERIVERFDPLRVILFGSLARGEMNYDSDIDLLVVFEEVE